MVWQTPSPVPGPIQPYSTGSNNVNILEIHHQRIFTSLPAKGLFTEIECEARDEAQMRGLVAALRDKGYSVEEVAVD